MIHLSEAEFAALRAQVASMAALLDAFAQDQTGDAPRECPHETVENEGTFGSPVWRCQECHQIVDRTFAGTLSP